MILGYILAGLVGLGILLFLSFMVYDLASDVITLEDMPKTMRRKAINAARAQARLDVLGRDVRSGEWRDVRMGKLGKRSLAAVQKAYVKEVGRLTNEEVRERVNSQSLNELSTRTTRAVRANKEAMKEINGESDAWGAPDEAKKSWRARTPRGLTRR